jgi:hypothetical protein
MAQGCAPALWCPVCLSMGWLRKPLTDTYCRGVPAVAGHVGCKTLPNIAVRAPIASNENIRTAKSRSRERDNNHAGELTPLAAKRKRGKTSTYLLQSKCANKDFTSLRANRHPPPGFRLAF